MSDKSSGATNNPECEHGNLDTCNACQMDWIGRVKELDVLKDRLANLEILVHELLDQQVNLRRILDDGFQSLASRLPEPPYRRPGHYY
jgi:hypothetical protein